MPVTAMMAEEPPAEVATLLMEAVASDPIDQDGLLSGGNALRLMGNAALTAANRHTNGKVVMTGATDMRFYQPVPIGHLLELTARIIHIRQATLTILVDGMIQAPSGGRRTLALSGYFQMTALDSTRQTIRNANKSC